MIRLGPVAHDLGLAMSRVSGGRPEADPPHLTMPDGLPARGNRVRLCLGSSAGQSTPLVMGRSPVRLRSEALGRSRPVQLRRFTGCADLPAAGDPFDSGPRGWFPPALNLPGIAPGDGARQCLRPAGREARRYASDVREGNRPDQPEAPSWAVGERRGDPWLPVQARRPEHALEGIRSVRSPAGIGVRGESPRWVRLPRLPRSRSPIGRGVRFRSGRLGVRIPPRVRSESLSLSAPTAGLNSRQDSAS